MQRFLAGCLLLAACTTAHGDKPCDGRIAASILSHDITQRQGAGLLINHCGRALRAEILVMALNQDGFPVAKLRTVVHADAAPISVLRIGLPFVQSVIRLSGYSTEVAATETLDTVAQHAPIANPEPAVTPRL
jgi:hypothetical protein